MTEITPANTHGGDRKSTKCHLVDTPASDGNATATSVLSRLKRDDPQLAEQVITGELTANAAARIKGWRKPRIVLSNPEGVAHGEWLPMLADVGIGDRDARRFAEIA